MSVQSDPTYEKEYNCLTTDLVDGYPPDEGEPAGSKMYVWDQTNKELSAIFKKVFDDWYKL